MSSGGGGSSQPTSQTITQSSIPKELMPYAMELLGKGQAATNQPYQAYQGPQVAGFSDLQNKAFAGYDSLAPSAYTGQAANSLTSSIDAAQNFKFDPAQLQQYQMADAEKFGQGAADQYMSPYIQNVMDQQKKSAIADYGRQLPQLGASAVQAGGLGGTRSALMQAEANRNLQNQMQGIEATGLQGAYQQAMSQFNADQARQQAAAQANLQAKLGVQQLGEQSRQYGAGLSMQGIQAAMQGAGQLGNLGAQDYNQKLQTLQAQQGAGALQQQQQQTQYNQDQQNFANAQNYPYKQLGFMSDLIRGTPTGNSSSTVYGGQPSTIGQVAGLAAGLGGLYMGKGG